MVLLKTSLDVRMELRFPSQLATPVKSQTWEFSLGSPLPPLVPAFRLQAQVVIVNEGNYRITPDCFLMRSLSPIRPALPLLKAQVCMCQLFGLYPLVC